MGSLIKTVPIVIMSLILQLVILVSCFIIYLNRIQNKFEARLNDMEQELESNDQSLNDEVQRHAAVQAEMANQVSSMETLMEVATQQADRKSAEIAKLKAGLEAQEEEIAKLESMIDQSTPESDSLECESELGLYRQIHKSLEEQFVFLQG